MRNLLREFLKYTLIKQFIVTFIVFSVLCLAIAGAERIEPTAKGLALNFGPYALLSALFILIFRVFRWVQNRRL